jgi:repressor LexA
MFQGMNELTERQREILDFIVDESREHGSSPTLREICTRFGFASTLSAREHLRLIEQKGYLKRIPGRRRGVKVLAGFAREADETVRVPIVGRAAAGRPITSVENLEGYVHLDKKWYRGRNLFGLRIAGESMKDAGIRDGDVVIVKKQETAEQGEIIVAMVRGEVTVKHFHRNNGGVVLKAANEQFPDTVIEAPGSDDFAVAGKVIGVMRKM